MSEIKGITGARIEMIKERNKILADSTRKSNSKIPPVYSRVASIIIATSASKVKAETQKAETL